jgi:predicted AAA+ superfamily ATPase
MRSSSSAVDRHLRRRHAQAIVERALRESRVVIVNGPRQAGKTTLSRLVSHGGHWVSLDSQAVLDACVADPAGFLEAYPKPLFIDEFQRAGDVLVRAIKLEVDSNSSRGQYLLTGSSRFLTVRTISESLAGRAQMVDLWPYAQGEADELGPDADTLLYRLFDERARIVTQRASPAMDRSEYFERVCRGGYPEVNELEGQARRRWFQSYLRTIVGRDVPEIARGRHLGELPKLIRVLAGRTGQELVVENVARETGIERASIEPGADSFAVSCCTWATRRCPPAIGSPPCRSRICGRRPDVRERSRGLALIARILDEHEPRVIRVYSREELGRSELVAAHDSLKCEC